MNQLKFFVLLLLLLFSASAFSHEVESIDAILNEIMLSQNASSIEQISCSNVAEHQFEELGNALMEQMHPGEAHETMDTMMGGEGSESLKLMHISMGKSYLRCDGSAAMMQGMMGPGMMQSMMGNYPFGIAPTAINYSYGGIWNVLYTILLIGLIALVFLGILKLWKDVNRK